jgi:hypothetical protein
MASLTEPPRWSKEGRGGTINENYKRGGFNAPHYPIDGREIDPHLNKGQLDKGLVDLIKSLSKI